MPITHCTITHIPLDVPLSFSRGFQDYTPSYPRHIEHTANIESIGSQPELNYVLNHMGEELEFRIERGGFNGIDVVTIRGIIKEYRIEYEKDTGLVKEFLELILNGSIRNISGIQKSKEDEEYPHKCYKCKKDLRFKELCIANPQKHIDYLKNLWELECIEFYCCTCIKEV